MPPADRFPAPDAAASPAAGPGPLPPGHPQAGELERLRLLYERGALAGADYWAVRAYILEQAMRAGVGGGRGGPPPLTPRDRLLGGVLWAAGFMLVLLAAGGVWKAGELLAGRPGPGARAEADAATTPGPGPGPGFGMGMDYGPGPGGGLRGWSLAAGTDWLLGRPPRPPAGFGPRLHAPFLAAPGEDSWPPASPPDGFGGFGRDPGPGPGSDFGPPGPPPDGFGPGFGPPGGGGDAGRRPPPR